MNSFGAQQTITTSSIVVAARDQVSTDLAGEAVILSLRSERYYGLNDVGVRIWDLLREPRCVADICDAVLREYDVRRDPCERDVVALLEQLVGKGLVEVRNGPAS